MSCESPLVVRLVDDVLGELVMDGSTGYVPQLLDTGSPIVRAVTVNRTDADGEDDSTAHHGASAVSLTVLLVDDLPTRRLQAMRDALMAYCHPSRRPWLYYVATEGDEERRLALRFDARTAPYAAPQRVFRVVQVGWRNPLGVEQAAVETLARLTASGDVEDGRTYPLTFPRVYPDSDPIGVSMIENPGNVPVPPVLRLYGPVEDPKIANETTGQTLEFTDLTIAAGDYVEVDVRERTVRLNSLVTQSRYDKLDFPVSEWWELQPGVNLLRYYPATFSPPALAEVRYRPSWF